MTHPHHRILPLAAVTLILTLASGCISKQIAGVPASEAHAAAVSSNGATCQFSVNAVNDLREEQSLGIVGHSHINGEGFKTWFENGIAAVPGYRTDSAPITLRIDIIKAYTQSLDTMKSVNLLVRVYPTQNDTALPPRVYRGVDNSTNWNNSQSEVQSALNRAMTSLQQQISGDIGKLCKG